VLKDGITDLDDLADAVRHTGKRGGSVIDPPVVAVRRPPAQCPGRRPDGAGARAVLALMAEGRSNEAMGDRLEMPRKTVEAQIANILSKSELPPTSGDYRRRARRARASPRPT